MPIPPLRLRCLCLALGLVHGLTFAQSSEEEELAMAYGDGSTVSIATGSAQPLRRAPAVATVITARDISALGATELDQVLESVAGMHVSMRPDPLNAQYSIRGIHTLYNPHVLVLVNGIPITTSFLGNRGEAWGGMPLENVARIEVLRGPGSALYGADAFSGVINVVTKAAEDIRGTEYGLRLGSFKERDAFVQYGGAFGPLQAALYLRVGKTEGQRRIVDADAQSALDQLFHTHSSLAPGPINAQREALDLRIDLAYQDWRLRAGYVQREVGTGTGVAGALDPRGRIPEKRSNVDLSYNRPNWLPHWDVQAVAGVYDIRNQPGDPYYTLFPAGAFGGAYPDGVVGNPGHYERHTHASVAAVYTELAQHRIRIGAGYRLDDMYRTAEDKNFSFIVVPGIGPALVPLGSIVDGRQDPNLLFLQPHRRNVRYLYAQDEWRLAKDWTLTAGVRHDRYSDFGGTTNPRVALVWDASYNVVVKALHGQAFRAPAFVEQYSVNNPVTVGNPNLKPERIGTSELVLAWQPHGTVQTSLTLFRYEMEDIIATVTNADPSTGKSFRNTGDQKGHGLELEAAWDAARTLRLSASLSLQSSTDLASGQDAGLAPRRRCFGRAEWQFAPAWQLGATANHVAGRMRQPGDLRPPVPNYSSVDASVRREQLYGNWSVRLSVTNLFNADIREPAIAPGNTPFDTPLAGRAFSLQLVHAL